MRSSRALAIAVAGAVVAAALVGATSVSAAEYTVLCKADEAPCKEGNVEEAGVKIAGASTNLEGNFTYLGVPFKLTCETSNLDESTTTQEKGNPRLEGSINFLNFENCKVGNINCTVGALNLRWRFLLAHKPGGGLLTVTQEVESGTAGVYIQCGGFFNCNFSVSDLDEELPEQYVAHLEVVNGESLAQINANEVRVITASGECSVKEVIVNATYVLSKPEPLWVSYVE